MSPDEVVHLPPQAIAPANMVGTADEAVAGGQLEKSLSFTQSLRLYRKAVFWSVALSTAIIMEGFDIILIGNFYAFPAFQRKFGDLQPNGSYELTAPWQTGLLNGSYIGQIFGLWIAGHLADRFGYRRTMLSALGLIAAFIFIPFFAPNIIVLLVGQIAIGVPLGFFQTLACTYASDVCPTQLRAYLTTYVNLCWVIGQIIASGVLRGLVERSDDWAFRIPFALQWFWPIVVGTAIFLAPESPWWLVRVGRTAEARQAVLRLTNREANPDFDADKAVAMMSYTNAIEKEASEGMSYLDCFRGIDLRRTEIVCGVWAVQALCGASFMGFSSYFYQQAGLSTSNAFTMTLVQFCLGGIGVFFSWFLMGWFGRRTLYLAGETAMAVILALIGFVSLAGTHHAPVSWAVGSLLLLFTFVYDCTVGPVCYSLISELSSTRLKIKTVVLARNLYNVLSIVTNIITPNMLNPTAWNWGARSGFFWAATCTLCLVWTFFRVPEPRGRTYAELDLLFEAKVSARKFKSTVVDMPHQSEGSMEKMATSASADKAEESRIERA
ncbi:alpha-glucosides permease MPH2/3 [Magnaporthiopsis poae ATCC 64411]|uniref:Alpha-glucosides permease MPH2/3 n=1 Tax=Magnaporthiopsis poae (strain ATCC 64411 / 73-15) TaxID=644358 RepID=A0A0C4E9R4_MAGP6|nr:alpha-glucosides permease MPH2/3 [Magnaporthiopsis poae ATCC 64411]